MIGECLPNGRCPHPRWGRCRIDPYQSCLVAPGSGVLHVARRATETHLVRGGGAYHRPAELLAAVNSAIAECVAAAGGAAHKPAAIGVASMAESGVPIDRRNLPVGDMLAWHDMRPERQAAWLERQIGAAPLFARTGHRPEPKYTLPSCCGCASRGPPTSRDCATGPEWPSWLPSTLPASWRRMPRWPAGRWPSMSRPGLGRRVARSGKPGARPDAGRPALGQAVGGLTAAAAAGWACRAGCPWRSLATITWRPRSVPA